jgi:hypothetical protein
MSEHRRRAPCRHGSGTPETAVCFCNHGRKPGLGLGVRIALVNRPGSQLFEPDAYDACCVVHQPIEKEIERRHKCYQL